MLMVGDCLKMLPRLKKESVDLVLCDPPYGVTPCKWDTAINLAELWDNLERILKPTGAALIFGTEPFSSGLRASNLRLYKYDFYLSLIHI